MGFPIMWCDPYPQFRPRKSTAKQHTARRIPVFLPAELHFQKKPLLVWSPSRTIIICFILFPNPEFAPVPPNTLHSALVCVRILSRWRLWGGPTHCAGQRHLMRARVSPGGGGPWAAQTRNWVPSLVLSCPTPHDTKGRGPLLGSCDREVRPSSS